MTIESDDITAYGEMIRWTRGRVRGILKVVHRRRVPVLYFDVSYMHILYIGQNESSTSKILIRKPATPSNLQNTSKHDPSD
jgi:hypothetical protein